MRCKQQSAALSHTAESMMIKSSHLSSLGWKPGWLSWCALQQHLLPLMAPVGIQECQGGQILRAIEAVLDMLYNAPKDKVMFIIGLSKFSSNSKPTSLHVTFCSQQEDVHPCYHQVEFRYLFPMIPIWSHLIFATGSCAWICCCWYQ